MSTENTEQFTSIEGSRGTAGSFKLLLRYIQGVPFLRWAFLPTVFCGGLSAIGSQVFLWLCGKLAECSSANNCAPQALVGGLTVTPSILILVVLALLLIVIRILQWVIFESGGQLASQKFFEKMVRSVGGVRTTFFDEYPSGKVINRFVKDADALRVYGPIRIGDTIGSVVELMSVAIVISFASPIAALIALPTFLFFVYVQRNIAPMLQHVMVLRSARFGEVLHRESDVIEGVRAFALYEQLPALAERLTGAVFRFMQMHFLRGTVEAWGRLLSDLGVAVYGSIVLAAVYFGIHQGTLSVVLGVVIITAAFRLGTIFGWLTWSMGLLFETAGNARRVFEYIDLPAEESEEGAKPHAVRAPSDIQSGDIAFLSYSMSYRPHTPVILKELSVTIRNGSKVGLVGRTGAGKSSFVQSLFRMVHVHGGDIRFGEASLLQMPIDQARALVAVVPQDPYLFEGTIRSNIDRLSECSNEVLQEALRKVQLSVDLDKAVLEGGSNLSLGERQLLCLARVIISKRPIVVMDEPTSGVDTITDAIIQSVLRTALHDRTIITIAHRLETLARMDRIIELHDGAIIRDGKPADILPRLTPEELA
jgi:ABC-type multidrug transport system fused ATPase/permease subunit